MTTIRINNEIHELEITRLDESFTRFDMTSDMLGDAGDWHPLTNDEAEWEADEPADLNQFRDWLRDTCARENGFDVFFDNEQIK